MFHKHRRLSIYQSAAKAKLKQERKNKAAIVAYINELKLRIGGVDELTQNFLDAIDRDTT